jgi:uncharacterized membrane protein
MSRPIEPRNQAEAQKEVDQLLTFRTKLEELLSQGVFNLPEDQQKKVQGHIDREVARLQGLFEIDTDISSKRLSLGMRIATFLGGAAFCAGIYYLFLRVWASLATPAQVAVVILGTLLAVWATDLAAKRERSLYYASLLGLVAFACFVVDLVVLGADFNITPSPNSFLVWGLFGLVLAYGYGMRLLLLAGLLSLLGFLSMEAGTAYGCYWLDFGERPENFIWAGLALYVIPTFWKHPSKPGFPVFYRLVGLLSLLLSILILSHWGEGSYLGFKPKVVEDGYQIVGFLMAGLAIWSGIKREHSEVTNIGATFFAISLYTKFYDWWWDWLPKYLFFLVVGGLSVALLFILKRLRRGYQGVRL